jgi:transmembrane sensor
MTDGVDELIDRACRGEATPGEIARLDAWRAESQEHERDYRATVRLLAAGRSLASLGTLPVRPSAPEIVARVSARARLSGRSRLTQWTPWAMAAAAAVIAIVAIRSRTVQPASGESGIPGWGASEIVTGAAELATVKLGEGSVVRLAPSSRLRVLGGRGRAVMLEGRAFFAVQRMPNYPLIVRTAAGDARVLGTRFELATDKEGLRLRVVEGRVALTTPREQTEVVAGQETAIKNGVVVRPAATDTSDDAGRWVGTFLAFQATPLGDAAREIERVYRTPVTITDTLLARETITASFTDRPVEEVVNVVCSVLNARCEVKDGKVRINR